ncbi:hypothetical protein Pcac1_g13023 [Phytophthora cactorum]|uniref:Uncharacterized protein n=1 Tax=Phytophthora cactorum TaxID=29920 RepID=A0A8T0YBZ8_9STRA|nr:hypothetical protein Pcac1_g13023 [Phytophthora cactorum]KAG2793017.1 hypothetical protein PC111_g23212 [Phytophthora cactorum]KAG2809866.1 hypothetical protein PC113_g23830 [Phytophthora cactorum]KAG2883475.1 hypothetical protein PC117_g26021 [Phytophthora cactorum]KAG3047258.1 hypothetical protein PC122_g24158 [Phytophthora cactorum]
MVSKTLSGYDIKTMVKVLNLKTFDAETHEKPASAQRVVFSTCYKIEESKCNISQPVVDVLIAYLILHYPRMKELRVDGVVVERLKSAIIISGSSITELLAWSS